MATAENEDGANNVIASKMAHKIVGHELNALIYVWYAFVLYVSVHEVQDSSILDGVHSTSPGESDRTTSVVQVPRDMLSANGIGEVEFSTYARGGNSE